MHAATARWLSAAEFLAATLVIIGHNVYHVVPNEVPILFLAGLISLRLRDGWGGLGFRRPPSWRRLILIALAAAALRLALGALVIEPLTARVWPPIVAPKGASDIPGNWQHALLALGLVWTFAAFGEEIAYRAYLITRGADIGGRTRAAWWTAMICASVLFGYGHFFKGPAGIVDSGIAGLILGTAYLVCGRNLWVSVLAHGFMDTAVVAAVYFGWSS
jgi:uncharacterized protein